MRIARSALFAMIWIGGCLQAPVDPDKSDRPVRKTWSAPLVFRDNSGMTEQGEIGFRLRVGDTVESIRVTPSWFSVMDLDIVDSAGRKYPMNRIGVSQFKDGVSIYGKVLATPPYPERVRVGFRMQLTLDRADYETVYKDVAVRMTLVWDAKDCQWRMVENESFIRDWKDSGTRGSG